ncbi:MAG: NADPH:quinone oxidoreductase family protein [Steroidobacteraceae bacterium]|jgi:NADPH2:quinone reductase|nr:NADPH:quinone oxidoreductase family protein [Steroidobacteraceae bacterium]
MRAVVCSEFGPLDRLEVRELPEPPLPPGHVRVKVTCASVNYPDALMVLGAYQVKPALPFVPGAELAGTVTEVGEGVTHLRPGDRVLALCWLGAFATEAVVEARLALPLDAAIDFAHAAALPMTYGTAFHALLDRAQLRAGETLLVLGAGGGVGLAAVELGRHMGATVIAAASSSAKLEAARARGADHAIDYGTQDLRAELRRITGGRGPDVILDPVGGSYAEPALRSIAWGGRYLVVGFAAGDIPRVPLNLPLLKGCAVIGVFWGEFLKREADRGADELRQLLAWLKDGTLRPLVSARVPLERAAEAMRTVHERGAVGKIVVEP